MTGDEKLKIAREGAVRWYEPLCPMDHLGYAADFRSGKHDTYAVVQSGFHTLTVAEEHGMVMRPSVKDVHNAARVLPFPGYFAQGYAEMFHAALFAKPDPLAPLRAIAREGVTDAELMAVMENMKGEVK